MKYYRIINYENGRITYTNYLPAETLDAVEEISFSEFQNELERVYTDETI
jgi:hypothetical protein